MYCNQRAKNVACRCCMVRLHKDLPKAWKCKEADSESQGCSFEAVQLVNAWQNYCLKDSRLKNLGVFMLSFVKTFCGLSVRESVCSSHFLFLSGGLRGWRRDRLQMSRGEKEGKKIGTDPNRVLWINGLHSLTAREPQLQLTKALSVPGAMLLLSDCICTTSFSYSEEVPWVGECSAR